MLTLELESGKSYAEPGLERARLEFNGNFHLSYLCLTIGLDTGRTGVPSMVVRADTEKPSRMLTTAGLRAAARLLFAVQG